MNRTEHKLRMSFEPDYAVKWEVLVEMKKRLREDIRSCLISHTVWTLLFFSIFRNPWSLFINPVLYLLGAYVYYRYKDWVMRRRLGI